MLRFVVLRHDCPPGYVRGLHWDFMLESGGVLKTWALSRPPDECVNDDDDGIDAELLGDHRLAYLDYEGPVSGDRGHVTRYDRGQYETLSRHDDEWQVELKGVRLTGRAVLRQAADDLQRWTFSFSSSAG